MEPGIHLFDGQFDSFVLADAWNWEDEWSTWAFYAEYQVVPPDEAAAVLREIADTDPALLAWLHEDFSSAGGAQGLSPQARLDDLIAALGQAPVFDGETLPVGARFYVAREKQAEGHPFEPLAAPGDPFENLHEKVAEAPRDFIVVEVLDADERPLSGFRLELLLADGEVRTRSTNAEGILHVDNIPQGDVHIRVPHFDGSAWRPLEGATSTRVDTGRRQVHVVQRGDNLSKIARKHGIKGWKKLWDAPENEGLRKKRKNPNVLYPGDEVVVPGMEVCEILRSTGQTHRIEVSEELVEFRVVLQDHNQLPYKNEAYELWLSERAEGEPRTGTTDGEGKVVEQLSPDVRVVRVELPEPALGWSFLMDELRPVPSQADLEDDADPSTPEQAVEALQTRLNALGFPCGPADGVYGPRTHAALALMKAEEIDAPSHDPEELEDGVPPAGYSLEGTMLAQADDMFETVG